MSPAVLRREDGQSLVLAVVFLVLLLGFCALALDVGHAYLAQRRLQASVDAAALAGANALPSPGAAASLADDYGADGSNAPRGLGGVDTSVSTDCLSSTPACAPDDAVTVKEAASIDTVFGTLFGVPQLTVHATATAQFAVPDTVNLAAPFALSNKHQDLSGTVNGQTCPCYDLPTTIPLEKNGEPGSFGVVDLDAYAPTDASGKCSPSPKGNAGSSVVGGWVQNGYEGYLPLGCYDSDPGAKFNSSQITAAMAARKNTILLFPVYDAETGSGSNVQYHVIGWAAFYVTDFSASGSGGSISGYFKRVVWDGIQSSNSAGPPDFGVHTIALVD